VSHLEEPATGDLSGVEALEACFDPGDADLAHFVGVSVAGGRLREELLPVGNLFGHLGPEERGQIWQRRT